MSVGRVVGRFYYRNFMVGLVENSHGQVIEEQCPKSIIIELFKSIIIQPPSPTHSPKTRSRGSTMFCIPTDLRRASMVTPNELVELVTKVRRRPSAQTPMTSPIIITITNPDNQTSDAGCRRASYQGNPDTSPAVASLGPARPVWVITIRDGRWPSVTSRGTPQTRQ